MKLFRSNTLGFPFDRFSLWPFDTSKGAGQQFIQRCGHTAKQIILLDDYCHKYDIQNISNLLRSTQNLVSFTMPGDMGSKDDKIVKLFDNTNPKPSLSFLKFLDVSSECPHKRKKICPTFYEELLEAAPNITTFCLNTPYYILTSTLEVLETIKKLGRAKSIENLTLPHVTRDHMNLFRSMSTEWNVKQLELEYGFNEFHGFELIKMFKNTLVALRINCNHGARGPQNVAVVTFADPMPKLRFLQLRLLWEVSLKCENFNSIFPALEKIDIDFDIGNCYGNQSHNNILITDEPCTITSLKSSTIRCLATTMQRIERIITIFPTLKILKCKVTARDGVEVVRNIWTRMTQLEELQIYGELPTTVNIDELITGIPAKKIRSKKMENFINSLERLDIEVRRETISVEKNGHLTRGSVLPSIRNLTNLRSLKLTVNGKFGGRMNNIYLTDVTGYFALYSLKNLQHLTVSNCELSESCAQILVKDKNLMTWKFTSSNYEDIIPRSCWRYKITDNRDQDKFPLLKF